MLLSVSLQFGALKVILVGNITPPMRTLVDTWSGDKRALQMLVDLRKG